MKSEPYFIIKTRDTATIRNKTHLFANWTTNCHSASVVCSRTWISFRHFLTIFSPLASITNLQMRSISHNSVRKLIKKSFTI